MTDEPFNYTGATFTVDGVTRGGEFEVTFDQSHLLRPTYSTSSLAAGFETSAEASATFDLGPEAYERFLGAASTPEALYTLKMSFGDRDPFNDRPIGVRALLRQMWQIVRYEFRKAAGLLDGLEITIPNARWSQD